MSIPWILEFGVELLVEHYTGINRFIKPMTYYIRDKQMRTVTVRLACVAGGFRGWGRGFGVIEKAARRKSGRY